jgi:hypothetical protein
MKRPHELLATSGRRGLAQGGVSTENAGGSQGRRPAARWRLRTSEPPATRTPARS